MLFFFFFQAEDGIRDLTVTGVQTCALPILPGLVDRDGGARADAHDLQHDLLVLRAVVVDLVRVVHDEAAGGDRRSVFLVPLRPGADPPGALQHDDVARLRVEVRRAEGAWRKLVALHVRLSRRGQAAGNDRALNPRISSRLKLDVAFAHDVHDLRRRTGEKVLGRRMAVDVEHHGDQRVVARHADQVDDAALAKPIGVSGYYTLVSM